MKKLYVFTVIIVFSFAFGRISKGHVSPPMSADITKANKVLIITKSSDESDGSVKWKRRHKKRKKSRSPNRGR